MTGTDAFIQFLNSVLSSIGGDGVPPTLPPPQAAKPESLPNVSNDGQERDRGPLSAKSPLSRNKRKAISELTKANYKVAKDSRASGPSNGLSAPDKPRVLANPRSPSLVSSSKRAVPYRGTSATTVTPIGTTGPAGEIPKAAPKKGSYAEIMARAKAAKTASPAVGVIKHKPKEKISEKKELLLAKKGLSAKGQVRLKPGQRGVSPACKSSSPVPGVPSTKKVNDRKIAQPAYKGTAKPAPAYRGTMKLADEIASGHKASMNARKIVGKSSRNRFAASSDDDIIDDEEDDLDAEDDEPYPESESDMEAGFSDVEEEEQMAVKAAKKEDDEEARIEAQHKSEKEQRRRKLEQMTKNAKKRSY